MRQYGIDQVELAWYGLDLKEGIAQGTSVAEARSTAPWSMKPSGTGGVVRVWNPDESGTLTITVDQESKLHQQLWTLHQADKLLRNVVAPLMMTDNASGEIFSYTNAFILNTPDESRGTESATFAWTFGYERKVKIAPAGDSNIVGS